VIAPDTDQTEISATEPDWTREKAVRFWDPSRKLLKAVRDFQASKHQPIAVRWAYRRMAVFRHRFWSAVSGADIPLAAKIGGGFFMPHPNGIVIHPDAQIGCNCLFFQQVTIGMAKDGIPTIEGHVDIGAGAKILGPITVGAHAKIGANAVVLTDVPAGASVGGVPGKILNR